ncbi:hypothetical protein MUG94_00530 [Arthrobacter gengyunqii]|uniref:DUF4232 domain-containing protein n=1 Tax=Arthrobacter gengyunqii TaxID=2886940 RepID=A0A9X1S788_9MICC|nr:hypothetical protein [Arthrobacter gengyunqii]MCC3266236.1 hypothetical protein [Arthrobacter gengyunqii]MCC3268949.1 hypothetical protein [Arthrobacter gengyunqii]UOY96326.1 hypothetical protein MUG94_00530 [Arthrobacter gengyunqii]
MVGNASSNKAPGRPSPAVYRRRRIVAGILALLVVIGLIAGIIAVAGWLRGDDSASAADTVSEATIPGPESNQPGAANASGAATAAPAPKPTATESAAAAPALCPAASVGVSATTDALSYAAGVTPVLTMTVTNTGAEPCDVNVGTSQMEFIVTSGSDRIFSSEDCQQAGEDLFKTIEPNTVETAKFTWDRQRSAPGCSEVASNPNPGTYTFTARLGDISSERTTFELE